MAIYTILVSKLLKLQSAMANKYTDMVEIFLKSPNVMHLAASLKFVFDKAPVSGRNCGLTATYEKFESKEFLDKRKTRGRWSKKAKILST